MRPPDDLEDLMHSGALRLWLRRRRKARAPAAAIAAAGPKQICVHEGQPRGARAAALAALAITLFAALACTPCSGIVTSDGSNMKALSLTGGYLTVPNDATLDAAFSSGVVTVELWAKAATTSLADSNVRGLLMRGPDPADATTRDFGLFSIQGAIRFVRGASVCNDTGTVLLSGKWVHVAVVSYAAGPCLMYINGVLAGNGTASALASPPAALTTLVGAAAASTANAFYGELDEVRVWKRARTAADIAAAAAGTTPLADFSTSNLLLFYGFDRDGASAGSPAEDDGTLQLQAASSGSGLARVEQGEPVDSTSALACPAAFRSSTSAVSSFRCTLTPKRAGTAVKTTSAWFRVSLTNSPSTLGASVASFASSNSSFTRWNSFNVDVSLPATASSSADRIVYVIVAVPTGSVGPAAGTPTPIITTLPDTTTSVSWQAHFGTSTPYPATQLGEAIYGTFTPKVGSAAWRLPRSSISLTPSSGGVPTLSWWPPSTVFWYTPALMPDWSISFAFVLKFTGGVSFIPSRWDQFCRTVSVAFNIKAVTDVSGTTVTSSALANTIFSICQGLIDYAWYNSLSPSQIVTFRFLNFWESTMVYLPRSVYGRAYSGELDQYTFYKMAYFDPDTLQMAPTTDAGFRYNSPVWGVWMWSIGFLDVNYCYEYMDCGVKTALPEGWSTQDFGGTPFYPATVVPKGYGGNIYRGGLGCNQDCTGRGSVIYQGISGQQIITGAKSDPTFGFLCPTCGQFCTGRACFDCWGAPGNGKIQFSLSPSVSYVYWKSGIIPDVPDESSVLTCNGPPPAVLSGTTVTCTLQAFYAGFPIFYRFWDNSVRDVRYTQGDVSGFVADRPDKWYFSNAPSLLPTFSFTATTDPWRSGWGDVEVVSNILLDRVIGTYRLAVYVPPVNSTLKCYDLRLVVTGKNSQCYVYPYYDNRPISTASLLYAASLTGVSVQNTTLTGAALGSALLPFNVDNELPVVITGGTESGQINFTVTGCPEKYSFFVTTTPDSLKPAHNLSAPIQAQWSSSFVMRVVLNNGTKAGKAVYVDVDSLVFTYKPPGVSPSISDVTILSVENYPPAPPVVELMVTATEESCPTGCTGPTALQIQTTAGALLYSENAYVWTTPDTMKLTCGAKPSDPCVLTFADDQESECWVRSSDINATVAGGTATILPNPASYVNGSDAQKSLVLTVVAFEDPPPGGAGKTITATIRRRTDGKVLGTSEVPVFYVPDATSTVMCAGTELVYSNTMPCTLFPARKGVPIWADAATVNVTSVGPLSIVPNSLLPTSGLAESFAFRVLATPGGGVLSGLSTASSLVRGNPVANATVISLAYPDNTSSLTCPPRIWAGQSATCFFLPRQNGVLIWTQMNLLQPMVNGSLKAFVPITGVTTGAYVTVNSTAVPSATHTGLGKLTLWAAWRANTEVVSASILVVDVPDASGPPIADNTTLACPAGPLTATVPFNCTFFPRRAGFFIYGVAENVTVSGANLVASVVDPPGTAGRSFTVNVTASSAPVPGGGSGVNLTAWLPFAAGPAPPAANQTLCFNATAANVTNANLTAVNLTVCGNRTAGPAAAGPVRLGTSRTVIVYIADPTSALNCSRLELHLGVRADCTLVSRRAGERVWVDASTVASAGEVALAPVNGSLLPPRGPSMAFVFGFVGQPRTDLTGYSRAVVLSPGGVEVGNFTILVHATPDNTSLLTCPPSIWAGAVGTCTFVPRMNSTVIWTNLTAVSTSPYRSLKGSARVRSGLNTSTAVLVNTTAVPSPTHTGPGWLAVYAAPGVRTLPVNSTGLYANVSLLVIDVPDGTGNVLRDNNTLTCPPGPTTALVPFTCTYYPHRAGFPIYGIPDNVTVDGPSLSASLVEAPGTIAMQFTVQVTPASAPVPGGRSGINMTAWVPRTAVKLGTARTAVVYLADGTSSLNCSALELHLGDTSDCTLVARRAGERVWTDASTVGSAGEGALAPVPGTLRPPAGPSFTFVFTMTGSPGSVLTGRSGALALSNGARIANHTMTVFRLPDETSVLTCPDTYTIVPQPAVCTFYPRWLSRPIVSEMSEIAFWGTGSVADVAQQRGIVGQAPVVVYTSDVPDWQYTGPGAVLAAAAGNRTYVLATSSILAADVHPDATSKLDCNEVEVVGSQTVNCTFTPQRTGMPVYTPRLNMTFAIRGMADGSCDWDAASPLVATSFRFTHKAPLSASGGYLVTVGAPNVNGTTGDVATLALSVSNVQVGDSFPKIGTRKGGTVLTLTAGALPPITGAMPVTISLCGAQAQLVKYESLKAVVVTPPAPIGEFSLGWCDARLSLGPNLAGTWRKAFRYNRKPVAVLDVQAMNMHSPGEAGFPRVVLPVDSVPLVASSSYDPDVLSVQGKNATGQGLLFRWYPRRAPFGADPVAFANASAAATTLSNLTAAGIYDIAVNVTDVDGGEWAVANVTFETVFLPILMSSIKIQADFATFSEQYEDEDFQAEVKSGVAKAYDVEEWRVAAVSPKEGSVILVVNISAADINQADQLPAVAQSFSPIPIAAAMKVDTAQVAQTNYTVLLREANTPPTAIVRGSRLVQTNATDYWAAIDARPSFDRDGAVVSYDFRLLRSLACPLDPAKDFSYPVNGLLNVTTTRPGQCVIQVTVWDADRTSSSVPTSVTLIMRPRVNRPPVVAGAHRYVMRMRSQDQFGRMRLAPTVYDQDADGRIARVVWTQIAGPTNATLAAKGAPSGVVDVGGMKPGVYGFSCQAWDGGIDGVIPPLSAQASFYITVHGLAVKDSSDVNEARNIGQKVAAAAIVAGFTALALQAARGIVDSMTKNNRAFASLSMKGNPKVMSSYTTGATVMVTQMQRLAMIGSLPPAALPPSFRAFAGALGMFLFQFSFTPFKPPTPKGGTLAGRRLLQEDFIAQTYEGSVDGTEVAEQAFKTAVLFGATLFGLVCAVHLFFYLLLVVGLRRSNRLGGTLAWPAPQLMMFCIMYIPVAMTASTYMPLCTGAVRAGVAAFLIFFCVAIPACFLLLLVARMRRRRDVFFEKAEPLTVTGVGKELAETAQLPLIYNVGRKASTFVGQRAAGLLRRRDAKGGKPEEGAEPPIGDLLQEVDDGPEHAAELARRRRRSSVAARAGKTAVYGVYRGFSLVFDSVDRLTNLLDRLIMRGAWEANVKENGRRAENWSQGWELMFADFVDDNMAFATGVLALMRGLATAVLVGMLSVDSEPELQSVPEPGLGQGDIADPVPATEAPFALLVQIGLMILVDVVSVAFHAFGRPFISRWVNVVETATLIQETIMLFALLADQLAWGWDTGKILLTTAQVMAVILLIDVYLAQFQLLAMLLSMRTSLGRALHRAWVAAVDRATGRAAARLRDCTETRLEIEMAPRHTQVHIEWDCTTRIEWDMRPEGAAAKGEAPRVQGRSVFYAPRYSGQYDAALATLARMLEKAPAAADRSTRLRVAPVMHSESDAAALMADLWRVDEAVQFLREKQKEEEEEKAETARANKRDRLELLFPPLRAWRRRRARLPPPPPPPLAPPPPPPLEPQTTGEALLVLGPQKPAETKEETAERKRREAAEARRARRQARAEAAAAKERRRLGLEEPEGKPAGDRWVEPPHWKPKAEEEEEEELPAEGLLGDDEKLNELLGKHGILPREHQAAELERRHEALARLRSRPGPEAHAAARALRERAAVSDAVRLRRLRLWRSVARSLWRFAGLAGAERASRAAEDDSVSVAAAGPAEPAEPVSVFAKPSLRDLLPPPAAAERRTVLHLAAYDAGGGSPRPPSVVSSSGASATESREVQVVL